MEWLDLLFAAAPGKAEREEVDDDRESELKAGHRVEPVATNIAGRVNEKDQQGPVARDRFAMAICRLALGSRFRRAMLIPILLRGYSTNENADENPFKF
jgi:hypothetical protein